MTNARCRFAWYDSSRNTVYIKSTCILPDRNWSSKKERREAYKDAFRMTYLSRIERFASDMEKAEIMAFIKEHEGCKLSEYTDVDV